LIQVQSSLVCDKLSARRANKVRGIMVDIVGNTSQLSAEDLMAIASYIKSLPPIEGHAPDNRILLCGARDTELVAAEFGVL
jgi:hypothetical protein